MASVELTLGKVAGGYDAIRANAFLLERSSVQRGPRAGDDDWIRQLVSYRHLAQVRMVKLRPRFVTAKALNT